MNEIIPISANLPSIKDMDKHKLCLLLSQLFKDYLRSDNEGVNNAHTIRSYTTALDKFFAWCCDEGINLIFVNPVKATIYDIEAYRGYLARQGLSRQTINTRLVAVRRFYKFLKRPPKADNAPNPSIPPPVLYRQDNPASDVSIPKNVEKKGPESTIKYIGLEQAEALEKAARATNNPQRDLAIITMMFKHALRVFEVAKLQRKNYDQADRAFKFAGKRNKVRKVFLTNETYEILKPLIDGCTGPEDFIFKTNGQNSKGFQFSTDGMRKIVNRLLKQIGIAGRSCHSLRHGFATNATELGVPIIDIGRAMGHDRIDTTMQYIGVVDAKKNNPTLALDKAMKALHESSNNKQ